jgi:putative oxidoreductase
MSKQFPSRDVGILVLRLGLALIFLAHGYQKITRDWGTAWEPALPAHVQIPVAWIEFVGGILLLTGFLTRFAALAIAAGMCIAIYVVSADVGFLATEFGDKARGYAYLKVGWEFPFAMLVQAVTLLLLGGGAYSVDHCIWGRGRTRAASAVAPPAGSPAATAPTASAPPAP